MPDFFGAEKYACRMKRKNSRHGAPAVFFYADFGTNSPQNGTTHIQGRVWYCCGSSFQLPADFCTGVCMGEGTWTTSCPQQILQRPDIRHLPFYFSPYAYF